MLNSPTVRQIATAIHTPQAIDRLLNSMHEIREGLEFILDQLGLALWRVQLEEVDRI